MSELISRQAAIKDAESWVAVDEHEKHLQKNVVEWLKEFPSAEHGTNLAEVGKDVPDINVGEFISRQAALVAVKDALMAWSYMPEWRDEEILEAIAELPSAQPTSSKMEQVPTRCNLIDRQAAIEKILGQPPEPHYPSWYAEQIKELPPAEPKRETTTLRIGRTRNSVTMWYECAECGEPVDQEDAFCRRCGREIIHE